MQEATVKIYQEDEIIIRQDDFDKTLYKVMSGNVALYINYGKQEEYLVGILSFPKCFGEMSVLAGHPAYYTAVALNEARILCVPEDNFEIFIRNDYRNAMSIMKTMARNFALMNTNMNMLIEEIRELSKAEIIDRQAIERLAGRHEGVEEFSDGEPEGEVGKEGEECERLFACRSLHHQLPEVSHREYKKFVFPKKYVCPHCKQSFQGERVFQSKLVPKHTSLADATFDLQREYRDFEPEWYEIVTCPYCYFSALGSIINEQAIGEKTLYEQALTQLRGNMSLDFTLDKDLNFVVDQHYLALACSRAYREHVQIEAHLWTGLSGLYRKAGKKEPADMAAARAIEAGTLVYTECELNPVREQHLAMRLAGMNFYVGNMEEAQRWLARIRIIPQDRSGLADLAKSLQKEIDKEVFRRQKQG